MLKGGVIMDVTDAEQARIAEAAGAVAVMALERVPPDIRADGGVARMADPNKIVEIQETVTIPVMAKARIGHFVEAQILRGARGRLHRRERGADACRRGAPHRQVEVHRPVRCGCRNLGEALRRIGEGAAMIRTKGEAGTGDVSNAVRHMREVMGGTGACRGCARKSCSPRPRRSRRRTSWSKWVAENGRLPVVTFTAGGIANAGGRGDVHAVRHGRRFVGSGSSSPATRRPAPRRSSRRRRTTTTPRCSPASPPGSARRWSAFPPTRSRPSSCSRPAAGEPGGAAGGAPSVELPPRESRGPRRPRGLRSPRRGRTAAARRRRCSAPSCWHRRLALAELPLQDDPVGSLAAERVVDVEERSRPDLPVVVDAGLVSTVRSRSTRRRQCSVPHRVRDRVPVGDARGVEPPDTGTLIVNAQ